MEFYRYQDKGGRLDKEQWEAADKGTRKCLLESIAWTQQAEIVLGWDMLTKSRGPREPTVKDPLRLR
jgi:hypothetical protein